MNKKPLAKSVSAANKVCRFGTFLGPLAVLALQAAPGFAQESPRADQQILEDVIVTGTPGGAGIRKLDASFAITNINDEDIRRVAPTSTADLLKTIPGVWVESSGGVAGANIFVRGFPSGGDADYVTVSLNNMPVYPAPTLSFLENSTLFRVDETIARMEGLRGGPNPVYSNGQVGLTSNFILKEGGEVTEGNVKYTGSDYDLKRIDGVLSGKVTDDFYYMVGGYVSSSPGIRDAGYNAEEGHQFTVNLTKYVSGGKINFYHRLTDDHGTWYLPTALNVPGIDASYTQVGPANRQATLYNSQPDGMGGSELVAGTADMGRGRGWDGSITGGSVEVDFAEGWSFTNRFSLTNGAANTYGFVPDGPAVRLDSLTDVGDNPITSGTTVSGAPVSGDTMVQQFGPWVVEKDIKAFSNDLSIAKRWDEGKLTFGHYSSAWEVAEQWSIGNQKYHVLGHNGERIASSGGANEIPCNAPDVVTCTWKYDVDARGDASESAFYVAGELFLGDLTLDAGVRYANRKTFYSVDDGERDGVANFVVDADEDKLAFTAAANYALTEDTGVFARVNSGHKFADFDAYRDFRNDYLAGSDMIIEVSQFELGYKLSRSAYSLYATAFYNETEGQPFCDVGAVVECTRQETEAMGVELDGSLMLGNFALGLNATVQETEITNGVDVGNKVQRQPDHQIRLSPSYYLQFDGFDATVYGAVSRIGDRYSNNANTVTLPGYTKVDMGVIVNVDQVNFQLAVDNLTDKEGLTEGDPRNPSAPNGRYILPRSIKFSVGYNF